MRKTSPIPTADKSATIHTARFAQLFSCCGVRIVALPAAYAIMKLKSLSKGRTVPSKDSRMTARKKAAIRNQSGVVRVILLRHHNKQVNNSNPTLSHPASAVTYAGSKNLPRRKVTG